LADIFNNIPVFRELISTAH